MTKVKFFADETGVCGFEISGHSSVNCDDEEGKLLCSAISSAAYMTVNTVSDVIGDDFDVIKAQDGYMKALLSSPSEKSRVVLEGFKLHISALSEDFKKRICIITEV